MNRKFDFLKTTLTGGIIFLVPVVVLALIMSEAYDIMNLVAEPLADSIPIDSVAGFALANIITITALALVCFFSGLLARTSLANKFVESTESKILSKVPAYAFVKGIAHNVAGIKEGEQLTPVLAQFSNSWRVAFEIERIDGGHVVVFMPNTPNPWTGFVCFLPEESIKPLDISIASVIENFESYGKGSHKLLKNFKRVATS